MSAGPGRFAGDAIITPAGGEFWRSLGPVSWQQDNGVRVEIPAGTVFDGASIPRQAWSVIGHPMHGRYVLPSLLHDYECTLRAHPAPVVHRRFFFALRAQGVGMVRATIMWSAVRVFGPRWTVA